MKNKNIMDTFESFSPSEEQMERIYQSVLLKQASRGKRERPRSRARLAYPLIAGLALAAAAILLIRPNDHGTMQLPASEPDHTQYAQINIPPARSSFPAATDRSAAFRGFVLTAYAAGGGGSGQGADDTEDGIKTVLTPDVKVLLARYSPVMSSVPGLPFTVDITGDDKAGHTVDAIRVSADSGELMEWNRDTGVVSPRGQATEIDAGDTIYWAPGPGENAAAIQNATITVEAVSGDTVLGRQKIYITQDKPGYYYATVGELELL